MINTLKKILLFIKQRLNMDGKIKEIKDMERKKNY